jgi:hypothetical protein
MAGDKDTVLQLKIANDEGECAKAKVTAKPNVEVVRISNI